MIKEESGFEIFLKIVGGITLIVLVLVFAIMIPFGNLKRIVEVQDELNVMKADLIQMKRNISH